MFYIAFSGWKSRFHWPTLVVLGIILDIVDFHRVVQAMMRKVETLKFHQKFRDCTGIPNMFYIAFSGRKSRFHWPTLVILGIIQTFFFPVSDRKVPGISILRSAVEAILKVCFAPKAKKRHFKGDFENLRSEFQVSAFLIPGKKVCTPYFRFQIDSTDFVIAWVGTRAQYWYKIHRVHSVIQRSRDKWSDDEICRVYPKSEVG